MKVEEPVKSAPDPPDLPMVVNSEILEDVLGVNFFSLMGNPHFLLIITTQECAQMNLFMGKVFFLPPGPINCCRRVILGETINITSI